MPRGITCRLLRGPTDPALESVKEIYEASFPKLERKPTSCFDQMLCRDRYAIAIAEVGAAVAGFAAVYIPASSTDAALLEYLAVKAGQRGCGVGTGLLQFTFSQIDSRPVLVEVESADDEVARRRRAFYSRNGFLRVEGLRYVLPLPNSPPMELMIVNQSQSSEDLPRWLTLIYQEVYGVSSDDGRLRAMLEYQS